MLRELGARGFLWGCLRWLVVFILSSPLRCAKVLYPDGSIQSMTAALRERIQNDLERMASDALRTLALAMKTDCGILSDYDPTSPTHQQHPAHVSPLNRSLLFQHLFLPSEADCTKSGLLPSRLSSLFVGKGLLRRRSDT